MSVFKCWMAVAVFFYAQFASGQCHELFFSEYVEGFYNNKAVEIYNPTAKTIQLNQYRITTWHNGTPTFVAVYSDTLTDSIGPNQVRVIVLNKRNEKGTGLDTPVSKALAEKADYFFSSTKTNSMSLNFNGDDPVTLDKKSGSWWQTVDIIGKVGEKPVLATSPSTTIGWSDSFPFNSGKGTIYTRDHTLIRKPSVTYGDNVNPSYFNPKIEWDIYPVNTFDSLGFHRCECNKFPASAKDVKTPAVRIFPNPAHNIITVMASAPVLEIKIFTHSLQNIQIPTSELNANTRQINLADLQSGIYLLQIEYLNGDRAYQRIQKLD